MVVAYVVVAPLLAPPGGEAEADGVRQIVQGRNVLRVGFLANHYVQNDWLSDTEISPPRPRSTLGDGVT